MVWVILSVCHDWYDDLHDSYFSDSNYGDGVSMMPWRMTLLVVVVVDEGLRWIDAYDLNDWNVVMVVVVASWSLEEDGGS